ncbi:MAG: radical SAM family heme chaperone HemW [Christensenella sp.]
MLGLYVHIPFCLKKCNYCDFVSVECKEWIDAYFCALKKEIEITGKMYKRKVDSVFFGGGTPSYPSARYIAGVLDNIRENYDLCEDAEITLEANPCSLTPHKLNMYRAAGVNRLSIGLQAAQENLLKTLGRSHTKEQFDAAFNAARAAGFSNINIDVIYAVPKQTPNDWIKTLQYVMEKKPEHISAYALKIESGTPIWRMVQEGELTAVDEDADIEMYHAAQELLEAHGYTNYEISNFAKDGCVCAHNMKYWNVRDYLGLGAAAHSCIDHMRFANTDNVEEYIERLSRGNLQYASSELVSDTERKLEYIMLKLRLKNGFTFYDYKSRFNEDFRSAYSQETDEAIRFGLAKTDDRSICPTRRGFDLQNQLVAILTKNL